VIPALCRLLFFIVSIQVLLKSACTETFFLKTNARYSLPIGVNPTQMGSFVGRMGGIDIPQASQFFIDD
jgi:hypothetical protein